MTNNFPSAKSQAGAGAMDWSTAIIKPEASVLVTGAAGFVGLQVVKSLLRHGFRHVRCFVRPAGNLRALEDLADEYRENARLEIAPGNLLSPEDCEKATRGIAVIYHLAAGRGEMFADAFINSVVSTRNLLRASANHGCLVRFVNVSSFAVYSNRQKARGRLLDETSPTEQDPAERGDAYTYAKVKQDEMVMEYGRKAGIRHVIVRPGVVYGPGNDSIPARVGIGTFGVFLHLGGSNAIPLTYVDNCADAIVLAGVRPGVDGEVFNIVDDDLPSSRKFLRLYKREVKRFRSLYVPHAASYLLCWLWEKYSIWSEGQLPPTFNWRRWHAVWKKTSYSNTKIKTRLAWTQGVSSAEGMNRYFEGCRKRRSHA